MPSTPPRPKAKRKVHRLVIVEDHPVVVHGITQAIERANDMELCGQASSMTEALALVKRESPDLVLIDLSLEDGSGVELIKHIKSMGLPVKMLVNSMHDDQTYAERCLKAGAHGYVNKDQPMDQLLEAMRTVLKGRVHLSAEMADEVLSRMTQGEEPAAGSPVEGLSDRELEVFEMIGRGLTTRQIAEKLMLSPKTIETHREHIKEKLHVKNNTQLIRRAVQWTMEQA